MHNFSRKNYGILLSVSLITASLMQISAPLCPQARAQSWAEQQVRNKMRERQALEQQAREGYSPNGLSGQALQSQRWQQEWVMQHPGQPMPSAGAIQKMHTGEINAGINSGFARMRQQRQAQLQGEYLMAKQMQQQKLAAQHITWTPQQWQNWNRQYDQGQKAQADAYLDAIKTTREIDSEEMRRRALGF